MNPKLLTLVIVCKDNQVLLGMKKRGFGVGKWNGFGGKVHESETIENAAKRELQEESGLVTGNLEKIGVLIFQWQDKPEILEVTIFKTTDFFGQPQETEEMSPKWFNVNEIPFEEMWADDQYWFPLFIEGKKFKGTFVFDDKNTILKYQLHEDSNII